MGQAVEHARKEQVRLRVVTGSGELAPLDQAYQQYAPYVARVILRLSGRHSEIEDLVQDVFVEAARGIGSLREPEAAKGWLATIAIRVVGRRLRARRLRRAFGVDGWLESEYDQLVDPGASPHDRALLAAVYRILDELPTADRVAWSLHHVEGETLERVAHLCRCSLATAKRRIARVQKAVAEAVGDG